MDTRTHARRVHGTLTAPLRIEPLRPDSRPDPVGPYHPCLLRLRAIQSLAAAFLRPYVWIAVGRVGSTVGGITQRVWLAPPDKRLKLQLVVQALGARSGRTLVFVEKKRTATWLKKMLGRGGPEDAPEEERFPPIAAEVRSQ